MTLVSFNESQDLAAAWGNVAATPDPHVTVTGDDILVPELDQIVAYAHVCDQTVASQARLRAPSMLAQGFEEYATQMATGLVFGIEPEVIDRSQNPIQLDRMESLQCQLLNNPGAAAQSYHGVWLADGPLQPVTGNIRTLRATAAVTVVVTGWTNGALTFPVSLKAGRYQVVGMSVRSVSAVFARLVFSGGGWRPGCPVCQDEVSRDHPLFRNGMAGVWGEFDSASPPTIDLLGVTSTVQEVFLDLIYMG